MVLSLMPVDDGPIGFSGQDKLLHLLTFALLFIFGVFAFPHFFSFQNTRWVWLYLGLFSYGMIMELLQGQTTYRSMEFGDLVADVAGLVLGNLLLTLFPGRRTKTS